MEAESTLDLWYVNNLRCPRCHQQLKHVKTQLICAREHAFHVVDGVPVMLLDDVQQTIAVADATLMRAKGQLIDDRAQSLYLETLSISDEEKRGVIERALNPNDKTDPVVAFLIAASNGLMYRHLIGKLHAYPIPELRLPPGRGERFLDIGCSWGRWSVAAAQKGYDVIGIDPSIGAIMAARRVSRQLGLKIKFLVADARFLPFAENSIDYVFSYSVLQHLSHPNLKMVLPEIRRTLTANGTSLIQMPNKYGIRCIYHQAKRLFSTTHLFDVRYLSVPSLEKLFSRAIGNTEVSVDCYFGIGLQAKDIDFMPSKYKYVIRASELLRKTSLSVPALTYLADSVYLTSKRR